MRLTPEQIDDLNKDGPGETKVKITGIDVSVGDLTMLLVKFVPALILASIVLAIPIAVIVALLA